MTLPELLTKLTKTVKSNSPEILTALGVSGVITTAYLAGKASFKAAGIIASDESVGGVSDVRKENFKRRFHLVWREYIPAGISGVATVACVVGASKANIKRTTAAVTAYSLTERAFSEYKEKVVEQIGKGKEQKIRDEIAQDKVLAKVPGSQIVVGPGYVLCCELFTHRYFRSEMETLRKAENMINGKIVNEMYVTLDEFYELIGLSSTSNSNRIGWDSNKLMKLEFSTVLSENGEPCLAFDYNYTKPL